MSDAPRKRSWLPRVRYSLRTLVIGVLLIGSGMGLWWKWEPWVVERTYQKEAAVTCGAFSGDGELLAFGCADGSVEVWDANGRGRHVSLSGHTGWVQSLAFPREGSRLLTASRDGTARLWDAKGGGLLHVFDPGNGLVCAAALSPDGSRIVTGSWDGFDRIWNVSGPMAGTRRSSGGSIAMWDAATGEKKLSLGGHSDDVYSICFAPDGQRFMTTSADRTARIWDLATGKTLVVLAGHSAEVWAGGFSPDGERAVTGGWDKSIRVWDSTTGQEVLRLTGNRDEVWSTEFSRDGKLVVSASSFTEPQVWDAALGTERGLGPTHSVRFFMTVHERHPWSAAISHDGSRVAGAGDSDNARVWSAESGELLAETPATWRQYVDAVVFSPDDRRLLVRGASALVWLRRRPEYWWGVAWLAEFWLTVVFAGAFVWSVWRDRRTLPIAD